MVGHSTARYLLMEHPDVVVVRDHTHVVLDFGVVFYVR